MHIFRSLSVNKALPFVIGGLIAVVTFFASFNRFYDDPFITYRYTDNIVRGLGMVYNEGERILSTTTPLFALLLIPFRLISYEHLPVFAKMIGSISLAAGGLLLWDLGKTWKTPFVGWAGLFLYPIFGLLINTNGSETPLYMAFLLGCVAMYARNKYSWAAFFAALAILTRGDGVLLPAILALDYLIRVRKPIPWDAVILGILLLMPWLLFGTIYFGSPLPVTLDAKQAQGLLSIGQKFAPGFLTVLGWFSNATGYYVEAVLALVGLISLLWRGRQWWVIIAWGVLYFAAYTYLGVTRYFWYYAPLVLPFVVLVGLGVDTLTSGSGKKNGWRGKIFRAINVMIFIGLIVFQGYELRILTGTTDPRQDIYQNVGEWLSENTPADASIGMLEVGIMGYYAQRPIIDFAGLIQPEVAEQFGVTVQNYAESTVWTLDRYQPDYVVLQQAVSPNASSHFTQRCTLSQRFSDEVYPQDMLIYDCRP